jgi:oxygen-independent coproporphyrinogen-3 oxidase
VHIYIHVPFCARRCSYCDFAIAVRKETPDAQFVAAIEREWRGWIAHRDESADPKITTLYFGGGTPSRLQPASIAHLVRVVSVDRPLARDAEVTLETNPDDVTPERAMAWRVAGVNRVSLGVQSHDPAVLEWMHRTHRAEQVLPAIAALRAADIVNISIDLIFALPSELRRDWTADLERTFALEPTHVSLYGLTVEPHTPLFRWTERGSAIPAPDERYAEEYLAAHQHIRDAGFEHYEVSNAGRPGFRSRHNSVYWTGADYLGLGPSAHSLADGVRRWNVREWADYQLSTARGESVVSGTEALGDEERRLERRYLGLRTAAGLAEAELPANARESWLREGWATVDGGRVRLTVEGWLRLDALVGAAGHF